MNDNLNLLKTLCEVDSRWAEVHHGKGVVFAVCNFSTHDDNPPSAFHPYLQLYLTEDGSIHGGEALFAMVQEMIAGRALIIDSPIEFLKDPAYILTHYIEWKKETAK
jgi:hypothetical protein